MVGLWFGIVALTVTAYVVMDGFDLGAGALHLLLARTDAERRQILAAIGPLWDGNEVWLLATGGVLFAAFPKVLAAGLSGFYLAIFLVLWCLIARGLSIEMRSHLSSPLWRDTWDLGFCGSSALLALFLGAALGNLVRGVALRPDGWFSLPLFTDFSARPPVGILDWYTILVGCFALLALAGHGAAFLAWKTGGPVAARAARWSVRLLVAVAVAWPAVTLATNAVDPGLLPAMARRPLGWLGALGAFAGLGAAIGAQVRGRRLPAFLGSCGFLAGLLTAAAAATFPVMLRSAADPSLSITAHAAAASEAGLRAALRWWLLAFPLVLLYFAIVFRRHRGPAAAAGHDGRT